MIAAFEAFDRDTRALCTAAHGTEGVGIASSASSKVHDQSCESDLCNRFVRLLRDRIHQLLPFGTPQIAQAGDYPDRKEDFSIGIEHGINRSSQPAAACFFGALALSSR